ncbi:zinc ribbon domain-containing protein [Streptomyces sp. NPDC002730]|uniref:zinc ribbon domain-containing protein n=1 Tax=Streptomyces sp. NPDC002730 TaxID=3364662 RepID=UPI0036A5CF58
MAPPRTRPHQRAPVHGHARGEGQPRVQLQRCHACGFVTEGSRESQAVLRCKNPGCGNTDHADVNAAKNLKAAGHAVSACGDLGVSRSTRKRGDRPNPLVGNPPPSEGRKPKHDTSNVATIVRIHRHPLGSNGIPAGLASARWLMKSPSLSPKWALPKSA